MQLALIGPFAGNIRRLAGPANSDALGGGSASIRKDEGEIDVGLALALNA